MTLDEIHNELETIQRELTQESWLYTNDEIEFNGELIKIVEELKVYKKALELACSEILMHRICTENYIGEDEDQIFEWILEEARDEQ